MADKEATVYIVDMGASMRKHRNGREESDLDFAMHYVWDKISTTIAAARKTWNVGVIGLRTDGTKNTLEDDEAYEHISVLKPIDHVLMSHLRELQSSISVSKTNGGDAISAIVIAVDMIQKYTRKLKFFRKIVLVTNGRGNMDTEDLDQIAAKMNEDSIELIVL